MLLTRSPFAVADAAIERHIILRRRRDAAAAADAPRRRHAMLPGCRYADADAFALPRHAIAMMRDLPRVDAHATSRQSHAVLAIDAAMMLRPLLSAMAAHFEMF